VVKGGGQDLTRSTGQVKSGDVTAPKHTVNLHALKAEQVRAEIARLEDLKRKIEEKINGNQKLAALKSQLRLDMTRDGLRIQIVDEQNRPMFDSGSAIVRPAMRDLLREIGSVLAEVPNRLTLEGHTDAVPFPGGDRGYSNWELSSDRANASRRELINGGLPDNRTLRVQGLASSSLFERDNPESPANRRISIIVMNRDAEDRFFRTAPAAEEPAAAEPPPDVTGATPTAPQALPANNR